MLLLSAATAAAALITSEVQVGAASTTSEVLVALDLSATKQPIDGFGTSLCWWAVGVGGWSNDTAFELYMDKFFGDPATSGGLGLNQVRYNIGGSDVAAGDGHFLRPGGFVQTYLPEPENPSATAVYDWTADSTQRRVVAAAKKRGVQYVQAFANSPPWWMTVTGSVTGSKNGKTDNLRADQFDAFADYLARVCQHFHSAWNVTFDSVTPLNEPVTDWWKLGKSQEGCHFDRSSQSRIVGLTAKALKSLSLPIGVSAAEENWVDDTLGSVSAYAKDDLEQVTLITTHTYNGRPGQRQALSSFAATHGKRLWASEYGDGDTSGLTLAKRITLDLNEGNFSVWTLWQVADLDNSLTVKSGWGLTAATYCGCEHGESCECRPPPPQCAAKKDTWTPSWSHDPHAACQQWSVNTQWGALKGGQTLAEACRTDFGKDSCALTCCEASPKSERLERHADFNGAVGAFAIRKSFYAYRQFTAHIRPGSVIIAQPKWSSQNRSAVTAPVLLAALDPRGRPVLVYTNDHASAIAIAQPLAGMSGTLVRQVQGEALCAAVHVTSEEYNSEHIGEERLVNMPEADSWDRRHEAMSRTQPTHKLQTTLLPYSVTTFVVDVCSE
jgi:O-glycosyl hydrolase